jgi:hypothetical protein
MNFDITLICECCGNELKISRQSFLRNTLGISIEPCSNCLKGLEHFVIMAKEILALRDVLFTPLDKK